MQNKGSIYITFYKYYLPSTSSFIGHLFCYNEIFVFWSHLFPIIFSHRVIHTERIEISGLFFKAALVPNLFNLSSLVDQLCKEA